MEYVAGTEPYEDGASQPMIPDRESMTVEFKSDRDRLPDRDLVAAVVCLANAEGGELYVGVEEDGTPTGLHEAHHNVQGLAAMIANRTVPPLSVRVEALEVAGNRVAKVNVPKSRQLVATSDGVLLRRRLMADGTPQCAPFYPHEFAQRRANLGLLDYTATPVDDATLRDFDPLERARLRDIIQRYGGDRSLVGLRDDELDGALGLVQHGDGKATPTVAGLLLLGNEAALRQHLPTHEVAFQVLEGTQVRVNDFMRAPLLKTFERVMQSFSVRVEEEELQVGLFRVPVPDYDHRAFREALVNALIHRDYAQLGAVHVRMERASIVISNPGDFVEGVTLENLLVVEPRPRNPLLADTIKRIGLAERTGRGVDLIYQGLLRYGRAAPDYSRSGAHGVVVEIRGGEADLGLLRIVLEEEERSGNPLPVDAMIALSTLRHERRLDTATLAKAIQRDETAARGTLERLVEAGLVEAHGVKRGRTYTLSANVYRTMGASDDYIRQVGFDPIQQEQMVIQYVKNHGEIARRDAASLCRIGEDQASRLLRKLASAGKLRPTGRGRGAKYQLP